MGTVTLPVHRCPDCGSTSVERSATRTLVDRLVRLVGRRRLYICRDCACTFWDRPLPATPPR